jgi:hypothetical protein
VRGWQGAICCCCCCCGRGSGRGAYRSDTKSTLQLPQVTNDGTKFYEAHIGIRCYLLLLLLLLFVVVVVVVVVIIIVVGCGA